MSADPRLNAELRRQFIAGLRDVAEFYEQNPTAYYDGLPITLNMYVWGGGARRTLRETGRLFGLCSTIDDNRNVTVTRSFNGQIALAVFAPCGKLGRRPATAAPILPAPNAPLPLLSLPYRAAQSVAGLKILCSLLVSRWVTWLKLR